MIRIKLSDMNLRKTYKTIDVFFIIYNTICQCLKNIQILSYQYYRNLRENKFL